MPVIKDQITTFGGIMPDHVGDRGAAQLDPGAYDHRYISQMQITAYMRTWLIFDLPHPTSVQLTGVGNASQHMQSARLSGADEAPDLGGWNLLPEHHFDISVSPGQPVKYSHKLLFALFEAVDAVLTREDDLRRIRLLIGK